MCKHAHTAVLRKDDRAPYTAIPSLHVAMENRQGDLIEVLCPEHFSEILFYEIIKANRKIADKRLWIIRCKRCNRIFANHKQGRSVFYCNYKDNNGYSCHDIVLGSFEGWNKSEEEKRIQRTFISTKRQAFRDVWEAVPYIMFDGGCLY